MILTRGDLWVGRSKVLDYATDQITVYKTCPYGCRYCFWRVPLFRSRLRRMQPKPIQEAMKYSRMKNRVIVISFTTDPYPPQEEHQRLTRRVLEILSHSYWNKIMILTKNPKLALRDLDIMLAHGRMWLGSTVIHLNDTNMLEPNAPPVSSRLEALRKAHEEGVTTWLSIEPIIPPITNVKEIVKKTHGYVDFYVLGAFNYAKQLGLPSPTKEEYLKVLIPGITALKEYQANFIIKKELRRLFPNIFGR